MSKSIRAVLCLSVLLMASCHAGTKTSASSQTVRPSADADVAALRESVRRYDNAVNAGNLDRLMKLWADDAVMIPPEGEMIEGKAACRVFIGQGFDLYIPEVHSTVEEIRVSGDLATVRLTYEGISRPRGGGDAITIGGHWVNVYARDTAIAETDAIRGWRLALEIWTASPPAPRNDATDP